MKLLTKEISRKLPLLSSMDGCGDNAMAQVKLFTPWDNWTWYGIEFDPQSEIMFGLTVSPGETVLGYWDLAELRDVQGPFYLKIERDINFTPKTIGECRRLHAS